MLLKLRNIGGLLCWDKALKEEAEEQRQTTERRAREEQERRQAAEAELARLRAQLANPLIHTIWISCRTIQSQRNYCSAK